MTHNLATYRAYLSETNDPAAAGMLTLADAISSPDVMTLPEVASTLRLSRSALYRLIDRGEIPTIKVGRSVRFRRSDVLTFIDGGRL